MRVRRIGMMIIQGGIFSLYEIPLDLFTEVEYTLLFSRLHGHPFDHLYQTCLTALIKMAVVSTKKSPCSKPIPSSHIYPTPLFILQALALVPCSDD
jgi:hypothetical protein